MLKGEVDGGAGGVCIEGAKIKVEAKEIKQEIKREIKQEIKQEIKREEQ